MSENRGPEPDPAMALMEFASIGVGIVAADAMVKSSPVGSIYAGTVHPGKYLVLIGGDTGSVEEALEAARGVGGDSILDSVFLPDVHPGVVDAITATRAAAEFTGEALGIIETSTVVAAIEAADAGVKHARVDLITLRLADGLGGKGYAMFAGPVAEVETAVDQAAGRVPADSLVERRVIAQLHGEIAENLSAELRFMERVRARPAEREA